jgi:glycogen debranching enzyme
VETQADRGVVGGGPAELGIADKDSVDLCVTHLVSDELFSGWGIRTTASSETSYNSIGHHVGTDRRWTLTGARTYRGAHSKHPVTHGRLLVQPSR